MGDKCTRGDWLDHLYTIIDISNWCKNNEMQCSECNDKYGACRRNMAILEMSVVIHECFDLKEKEND